MSVCRARLIQTSVAAMTIAASGYAFAFGETATATLKLAGGADSGTVTFTEGSAGVLLKFALKGLPPGAHAAHIYEKGVCDGDFSSAGAIHNPLGAKHGYLAEEGPMAGDLPNVYAAADGSIATELLSPAISLSTEAEDGLFDSDGAAIVILEKADDYETDPDGGAGKRIACGVISIKK